MELCMEDYYFRIYAVTTEEGLKNICSNSKLISKICKINIKCVGKTEYPHEALFYFETYSIKSSEASELTDILKKYDYYEYVLMISGKQHITIIKASDESRYLDVCHTVNVHNDDGDDVEPLDASALDDLGIPQTRAPVPSMFKFTQVGDNNVQIENAEVVEIHHHK